MRSPFSSLLATALLLLFHGGVVRGYSSGDIGYAGSCTTRDPYTWEVAMKWVAAPVRSTTYEVVSDTGATEYTPCQQVALSVKVTEPEKKYIGLMIYATKDDGADYDKETKVGGWNVPEEKPAVMWTAGGSCQEKVLIHTGAAEKNYRMSFNWVAPPAGTGPVRFRALIKHGETNSGSFFYPGADLVLAERATAAPPQEWFRGNVTMSCTDVCAARVSVLFGFALEGGPAPPPARPLPTPAPPRALVSI